MMVNGCERACPRGWVMWAGLHMRMGNAGALICVDEHNWQVARANGNVSGFDSAYNNVSGLTRAYDNVSSIAIADERSELIRAHE